MSNSTTINDLPVSVIIDILQRVDQKALRNVALTCKLWKQLAEKYCSWSIVIYDHELNDDSLDYYKRTERKFQTLKIFGLTILDSRAISIFQKHGSNIRKLTLHYGLMESVSDLVDLLKMLPNVVELSLYRIPCGNTQASLTENDLPTLDKLKTLDCIDIEDSLLECFAKSKISTLKYRNFFGTRKGDGLIKFVKTQSNLKKLAAPEILSQLGGYIPKELENKVHICFYGCLMNGCADE